MGAALAELEMPIKSLRAVELTEIQLGDRPPTVRSLACRPANGPTGVVSDGCLLQAELEWEAPDFRATLAFRLANVASAPKLRLKRARLRGTLRLHYGEYQRSPERLGALSAAFTNTRSKPNAAGTIKKRPSGVGLSRVEAAPAAEREPRTPRERTDPEFWQKQMAATLVADTHHQVSHLKLESL